VEKGWPGIDGGGSKLASHTSFRKKGDKEKLLGLLLLKGLLGNL